MTPREARAYAQALIAAANDAESRGLAEIPATALDKFVSLDDEARVILDKAIKAAGG